jgi:hypothetical protein
MSFTEIIDQINKGFSEPILDALGVMPCCCHPDYVSYGVIVVGAGFVLLQIVNFVGT